MWFRVSGQGFGFWGLRFRFWVWGKGSRIQGPRFTVQGLKFEVWHSGFMFLVFRASGIGFRVEGLRSRV